MKIMAPVGDQDRLLAAIKAGADEVYMGVAGFGARRFAKNFSVDEYADAIDLAHRSNVAVHLTFNTVLSDSEINLAYPDIKRLYETGLDGVIVQDFGVASWLRESFPDLLLCASTQLSPGNHYELNWMKEQGFKRAVLARELSLEEMRAIREKTKIELEVFASGALCLGCSGKCYLSSFIGGRSGNRGICAQPCRQYYKAQELSPSYEESDAADYGYFLSLKDQLQGSAEVAELIKIGVDSIKVEGRMKSPNYVYAAVRYYRELIDKATGVSSETAAKRLSIKSSGAPEQEADEESRRLDIAGLFNRGYDRGYYYEHDPKIVNEFFASNFGVEVGSVRRDVVRLSQPLHNGDGVVFLDETARKLGGLNVSGIKLVDPTNSRRFQIVERAEPNDLVRFDDPIPAEATTLYRTFNHRLNKEIENALQQTRRREPIDAALVAKIGQPLQLTLKNSRVSVTAIARQQVEPAQKKGVDADSLLESLDRFGETPFYLASFEPSFDPNAFVPKSLLNQLRQDAVDALEKKLIESYRRKAPERPKVVGEIKPERIWASGLEERIDATPFISAVVRTRAQYDACKKEGVQKIYAETQPVQFESRLRLETPEGFAPSAGTLAQAILLEEKGEPFALDWFFNVGNSRAVKYLSDLFPRANSICLSPEISDRAVAAIVANVDPAVKERGVKLALPVYGRLLAMFTQKTLFDAPRVKITDPSDRRIIVEKNADRFEPGGEEGAAPVTGSSLYLYEQLDLIDAIPWILKSGVQELRFEFTNERFADVEAILQRSQNASASEQYSTYSYGFTRDGVF